MKTTEEFIRLYTLSSRWCIAGLAIGLVVSILAVLHIASGKGLKGKLPGIMAAVACIAAVMFCFYGLITGNVRLTAARLYCEDPAAMTLKELAHHNRRVPAESTDTPAGTSLAGSIIIFYRYGCTDCDAVYDRLKTLTKGREGIYWVCSRSDRGRALLQLYPIDEVPCAVYVRKTPVDGAASYVKKNLYSPLLQGLDEEALERILQLQLEGR